MVLCWVVSRAIALPADFAPCDHELQACRSQAHLMRGGEEPFGTRGLEQGN